eukprot:3666107-Alexandrium_andersonii.AAC.1
MAWADLAGELLLVLPTSTSCICTPSKETDNLLEEVTLQAVQDNDPVLNLFVGHLGPKTPPVK